MKDLLTNLIGYSAVVVGTSMMLPQVWKIWRREKSDDVSFVMAVFYLLNCVLWLMYGLLIHASPVILANGIALVISVVQVILIKKYAGKSVAVI